MVNVTQSTEVPQPPERVWDTITNLTTYPEWLVIHQGFGDGAPERIEAGSQFKQKVKIMGMPGEVTWTVSDADAPNEITLEGVGPMGTTMRTVWRLSAENGGTKVTYDAEFGGAALKPMIGPLEKESTKSAEQSLAKLREVLA